MFRGSSAAADRTIPSENAAQRHVRMVFYFLVVVVRIRTYRSNSNGVAGRSAQWCDGKISDGEKTEKEFRRGNGRKFVRSSASGDKRENIHAPKNIYLKHIIHITLELKSGRGGIRSFRCRHFFAFMCVCVRIERGKRMGLEVERAGAHSADFLVRLI